jgi:2-dehydropantoate 2-reductase
MRIAIFGTGGAGGYFGAHLALVGDDVTFIARGNHLETIKTKGLHVETSKANINIQNAKVTDDPSSVGVVDVILLGVKTWQVTEAARALQPMVGAETVVVPLQNGVEAPMQLVSVLGEEHVLGGLCATISWIESPGHIRSIGETHFIKFGRLDNRQCEPVDRLRSAFERAGVNVEVPPDINAALWKKFLFVVSFGGVGAVTREPIGVLRTMSGTRTMLQESMQEIFAVARARNISLPDDIVDKSMALLDSLPEDGTTSLQRDITAGKPSELESWNGAVVRIGCEVHVKTPLNTFIYERLLPLEQRARGQLTL